MNRNFIFTFILLAILSIVSAVPCDECKQPGKGVRVRSYNINTTAIMNALPATKTLPLADPLNDAFNGKETKTVQPQADPPSQSSIFQPCPINPSVPLPTISLVPDPPVADKTATFTVSGKIDHDITQGFTTLAIVATDLGLKPLMSASLTLFAQNIKAGQAFNITSNNVVFPAQLPPLAYIVEVAIGDPTGDPKTPLKIFTCGFGFEVNCSGK